MLPSLFIDYGLYGAVFVIEQALYLQGAQMGNVVRGNAVVIQQIPLTLKLHYAVMGSPTHYRLQDNTLISEGAVRIVARSVAEQMAVAR